MPWNYRRYATIDDPSHKSDLAVTGTYGCLQAFKRNKDLVADGGRRDSDTECNGRMVSGTALHECMSRALGNRGVLQKLQGGWQLTADQCRKVYDEEFAQSVAGRDVRWFEADEETIAHQRAEMISGALMDAKNHIKSVVLLEAGFIVKVGGYWCSGHVDIVYEPVSMPGTIALADWKSGQQKPHPIELDHSWESGLYSAAMKSGLWISREQFELPRGSVNKYMREREALEAALIRAAKAYEQDGELLEHVQTLGAFPSSIHYVHLADYPPYKRGGKKSAERPEELEYYGLTQPTEVSYKAGERRGPAWYRVRRTERDIPRLETLLRRVVGAIRMGAFFESIDEKCMRCLHREPCLNSGYEVRGAEKVSLEKQLAQLENIDDGLGGVGVG